MASSHHIDWVERKATNLRRMLNLQPLQPLDPFQLAQKMNVKVFLPPDVGNLPLEDLTHLLEVDSEGWSAGTKELPNGEFFIIINPNHVDARKRATLMEELSHIYLKHKPSEFILCDGLSFRTHKKTVESQAYWVGCAALIPRKVLEIAKSKNITREYVAEKFVVSVPLVKFRENVTGLKLYESKNIH